MGQLSGTLDILYVEDDGEDFSLFLDAVRENGFLFNIQRVNDGQELVDLFQEQPLIIFSNSKSPEEVQLSYDLGVNSFIQKPLSYQEHLQCIKNIHSFWFQTAQLP